MIASLKLFGKGAERNALIATLGDPSFYLQPLIGVALVRDDEGDTSLRYVSASEDGAPHPEVFEYRDGFVAILEPGEGPDDYAASIAEVRRALGCAQRRREWSLEMSDRLRALVAERCPELAHKLGRIALDVHADLVSVLTGKTRASRTDLATLAPLASEILGVELRPDGLLGDKLLLPPKGSKLNPPAEAA